MTEQPHVAVVSVTYNRCEPLLVLLAQLDAVAYPADCIDIFLVDNASADDTVERVSKEFPAINLITSKENLGTSAGFNLGMQAALGNTKNYEFIWLLDSDAEIESATLAPLVTAMQKHPEVGIIGSTVFDPDNRVRMVASGLHLDWENGMVSLNKALESASANLLDVDLVPACSLLVRTAVCRELGLWDERFWVYWGDTDWCLRIFRAGYRVCSNTASKVWHRDWANTQRGFNAPTVIYDDLRGGLLFNVRHNPAGSIKGAQKLMLMAYLKGAMEHLTMRPNFSDACVAATRDFFNGDFPRSDTYTVPNAIAPEELGPLIRTLKPRLPAIATVLINRIPAEISCVIRKQLAANFPNAVITERPVEQAVVKNDFTRNHGFYLRSEIRDLLSGLFLPRYDLVIADIGLPHLSTFAVARYTLITNASGIGVIQTNRRLVSVSRMIYMIFQGLKMTYFRLPRGIRCNQKLRSAVADDGQPDRQRIGDTNSGRVA